MNATTALILFFFILFISTFVQSIVEAMFGIPLGFIKNPKFLPWKPVILRYLAMLAGVGLSFFYQLDLINVVWIMLKNTIEILVKDIPESWVGYLLTGLGIGQGAIWLHELVKKILPSIPATPTE